MCMYVANIAGVSAQSFMQAFGLAQTAFNVQLASPQVITIIIIMIMNDTTIYKVP